MFIVEKIELNAQEQIEKDKNETQSRIFSDRISGLNRKTGEVAKLFAEKYRKTYEQHLPIVNMVLDGKLGELANCEEIRAVMSRQGPILFKPTDKQFNGKIFPDLFCYIYYVVDNSAVILGVDEAGESVLGSNNFLSFEDLLKIKGFDCDYAIERLTSLPLRIESVLTLKEAETEALIANANRALEKMNT
jgi:hypothetical protein